MNIDFNKKTIEDILFITICILTIINSVVLGWWLFKWFDLKIFLRELYNMVISIVMVLSPQL